MRSSRHGCATAVALVPAVRAREPNVAKHSRRSHGRAISEALVASAAVRTTKAIVTVYNRPRVNTATRLAEVALLDDARVLDSIVDSMDSQKVGSGSGPVTPSVVRRLSARGCAPAAPDRLSRPAGHDPSAGMRP